MEHWQFLIQKQGDRSWQPLESPNVAILEGRYRVVARSVLANTDVEVRITHFSNLEVPPKRRVHKRSRRTNAEGLMAVVPFTYFKPGIWELQCSGDLMSDLLGKSWQYSVQLQVLPQSVEAQEEGLRDKESAATVVAIQKQEDAIIDQPVNPVWLTGETAEQILQNLVELALPCSEPLLEDEKVEDDPPAIPELPLLLTLEKETYVARWGQTLTMIGCVQLKQTKNPQRVCIKELRLELRSPQSLEVLTQRRQALPEKSLPFRVKCLIDLPADCESKLILGDLSLYGTLTNAGEVILLASQSFTITADVTELLAISTIANKSELDLQQGHNTQPPPSKNEKLNLELFNIVKTKKVDQSLTIHPAPKKSLPPLLRPSHKSVVFRSPQLPKLPKSNSKSISAAVVSQSIQLQPFKAEYALATIEQVAMNDTIAVISQPSIQLQPLEKQNSLVAVRQIAKIDTTFPYLRRLKALPGKHEEANTLLLEESQARDTSVISNDDLSQPVTSDESQYQQGYSEDSVTLTIASSSELLTTPNPYISPLLVKWMHNHGYSLPEPIDVEFEDYNTYTPTHKEISKDEPPLAFSSESPTCDRNLALTSDLNTQAEEQEENSSSSSHHSISPSISLPLPPPPPSLASPSSQQPPLRHAKTPPAWVAQEIVVDDTYTIAEVNAKDSHSSQQEKQPAADLSISLPIAGVMSEPLPTPQLHVPEGELISGKSVRVWVQLPNVRSGIAVKLWVEDCQMRWLLDGPRLLTNLLPNSLGGLEVITQIHVPFGCLEIRLEAIAIDIATQQESHKVTVVRTVIPEDLPSLQLDDVIGL